MKKEVSINVHAHTATQAVTATVDVRDQSVNTEPPKEDRVVGTDPTTESRGVGTEMHDFVNSTPACQHRRQQKKPGPVHQTSHHVLPAMVVGKDGGGGGRGQACSSCGLHSGDERMVPMVIDDRGTNESGRAGKKKIRIRSSSGPTSGGMRERQMVPVEVPDGGVVLAGDGQSHQMDKGVGGGWTVGTRTNSNRERVGKVRSGGQTQMTGGGGGGGKVVTQKGGSGEGERVGKVRSGGQTQMTGGGGGKVVTQKGGSGEEAHDANVVVEKMVANDVGGGAIGSGQGNAERSKDSALFNTYTPCVAGEEVRSPVSGSLAKATQNKQNGVVVALEAKPPGAAGQQADACPTVVGAPSKLDAAKDATTAPDGHHTHPPGGLAVGQTVLARWPDRGWYHLAHILRSEQGGCWYLLESEDDTETIHCSDIVIPDGPSSFKVNILPHCLMEVPHIPFPSLLIPLGAGYCVRMLPWIRRLLCPRLVFILLYLPPPCPP